MVPNSRRMVEIAHQHELLILFMTCSVWLDAAPKPRPQIYLLSSTWPPELRPAATSKTMILRLLTSELPSTPPVDGLLRI
jgi:hypothetical protein